MSLQVGFFCYASQADAAAAACAAVVPSSVVTGSSVATLSCAGVSPAGALVMQTSVSPLDGSSGAVVSMVEQPVEFQPCQYSDYVAGLEIVLAACAGVWAIVWGYKRLAEIFNWSRGDA